MKNSPKHLLLFALTVLTLQGTAQSLPYKATTDIILSEQQDITTTGEVTATYATRFMPEGNFTLDLSLLMRSRHKGA